MIQKLGLSDNRCVTHQQQIKTDEVYVSQVIVLPPALTDFKLHIHLILI